MIVSSDQHVRSWAKFGHVGSTLRNILHSHETIWANNACIIEHADGRRYILERAGNAPLNLVVKCFPGYSDALSESQRAKYIQSNDNTFITRMLDRLGSTLIEHPRLECLELSMVRRTNTSFWMTRVERIRQPISVPSLRILRLDDLNILFVSGNRVELDMRNTAGVGLDYTPDQFLAILQGCPRLQIVLLTKSFPFLGFPPSPGHIVKLDHLEYLEVESPREWCMSLWTHIKVPGTAQDVRLVSQF